MKRDKQGSGGSDATGSGGLLILVGGGAAFDGGVGALPLPSIRLRARQHREKLDARRDPPSIRLRAGYFIDRKAATFVFRRRLHEITLFVFRADGLNWPIAGLRPIGAARGTVDSRRGFHVALWRQGDLGYALVSDVNEADLIAVGAKIAIASKE